MYSDEKDVYPTHHELELTEHVSAESTYLE